ncbi:hypothetical protein ISCGN_006797 [Ixodes scapularis]
MKCSRIFLLQIILLSIASSDGAHMLDEPQDATKLIVLEPTTGKQWFLGPILVYFKLGALGACQHWSSATMPLQKPLSHASHSRHATTAMKERSDIFLLQIILLSIASSDGAHMLDEPQDATKLIVLEPTTGKQWFLGPILVYFKLGALGACQHWSSATMPLQKPLSHASHSRHATTAMKERSDIFLLQKMKVKLAAQTLSSSVAKALLFAKQLGLPEFTNCEGTCKFIQDIDRCFDLLNSRSPVARTYKRPFNQANIQERSLTMERVGQNLMQLELPGGQPAVTYGRRMSVIAFAFTLKSVASLATKLLAGGEVRTTWRCSSAVCGKGAAGTITHQLPSSGSPTGSCWYAGVEAPNSANVATDLEGESLTVSQGTINPALDAKDDQKGDDLAVVYGLGEDTVSEFTS